MSEIFAVACAVVCAIFSLRGVRGPMRGRIRQRALPLLLLVLALWASGLETGHYWLPSGIVLAAGLLVCLAPDAAARVVPYALFALAAYGIWMINGFIVRYVLFYGLVPIPYLPTHTPNGMVLVPTRRLATFDGILAVSSPAGGPTIVVIEVPCALSSAKTSIS